MPTLSKATILVFGLSSLAAGVASLLSPTILLAQLSLSPEEAPASAVQAARGNALAAVAMGLYYSLAVYQDNTAFFTATVPMRLLTTIVFWRQGWRAPSVWEGVGAVLTAMALGWEWLKGDLGAKNAKSKLQ